jgi:uncharacterized membrane protein
MSVEVRPPQGGAEAKVSAAINRLAAWLARHWLALFNCAVAMFIGLPFLAPVLMEAGLTGPARAIYLIYAPTCHQLPERSFFLFGPRITPSAAELEESQAIPAGLTTLQRLALRFPGAPATGYKVAICERDTAIYGAILLNGLLFGALRPTLRRRGRMPKMPLWLFALFVLPAAVDGFTQLFGLRESTWYLRLITGAIFGTGLVWLAYPFVEEAMNDVVRTSTPSREVANIGPQTGQKAPPGV